MVNKCGDCHKCCMHFDLEFFGLQDDTLHFVRTWGLPAEKADKKVLITIDKPCQHLTDTGCDIYDERPEGCRAFRCARLKED